MPRRIERLDPILSGLNMRRTFIHAHLTLERLADAVKRFLQHVTNSVARSVKPCALLSKLADVPF
jgi:hypothetical protein